VIEEQESSETVWIGDEPCLACELNPRKCCGHCFFHCDCVEEEGGVEE